MLSRGLPDERADSNDSRATDGEDGRPSIRLENLLPLDVIAVGDGVVDDVVLAGACDEDEGPRCIEVDTAVKSDRGVTGGPWADPLVGWALVFGVVWSRWGRAATPGACNQTYIKISKNIDSWRCDIPCCSLLCSRYPKLGLCPHHYMKEVGLHLHPSSPVSPFPSFLSLFSLGACDFLRHACCDKACNKFLGSF